MSRNYDYTKCKIAEDEELNDYLVNKYPSLYFVVMMIVGSKMKLYTLKDTDENRKKFAKTFIRAYDGVPTMEEATKVYDAFVNARAWAEFK